MRTSLLIASLLLVACPAVASPPCECEVTWSYPSNDATGVPTNVQILTWSPRLDESSIALSTTSEPPQAVAVTSTLTGQRPGQVRIVPDSALAPLTSYSLKADLSGGGSLGIPFTTGDGPDDSPPVLTGATITGGSLSGACWTHLAAVVSVAGAADDQTPGSALLAQVDLVDPEAEPGTATISLPAYQQIMGDSGDNTCLNNAPGVEADRPYQAQVRLVDWAGNSSAPSEQVTFTFRKNSGAGGCGCGPLGPSQVPWAAAALMVLALLRTKGD